MKGPKEHSHGLPNFIIKWRKESCYSFEVISPISPKSN
jgi:hypothetical protein